MPLPTNPQDPWPPKAWQPIQRDIEEAAAWYSGDEARLINFYGGPDAVVGNRARGGRLISGWSRFWARRSADSQTGRQRLHVPAAADVAAVSADLLFGDEPRLVVPEAHEGADSRDATAAEERLAEIAEADGWASTLLEGAEVCAALGGVYLRVVWDDRLADHPMLDVVHCDHAVPEFRFGRLVAVTFWRVVRHEETAVWRHLERHEPGVILHGLYVGDRDHLGAKRPLADHPDTAGLLAADMPDGTVELPDGIDGLVVRYVPNVLPNRKHRGRPVGRSDTSGCEPLMDALDETYSAWMREVRLVKPRIVVPKEFLDRRGGPNGGRGQGAYFDVDAEIFSPLEMDPANKDRAGITVAEFALHTEDYERTTMKLFTQIVQTAGYSPQSFGLPGEGREQTATEVDAREGRSDRSTGRKRRYFGTAIEDIAEIALIVDREVFGSRVVPVRPRIEWPDATEQDLRETASALNLINLARAASARTRVKILHPDWDDAEVDEEAALILAEEGTAVGDPTGGAPPPDEDDDTGAEP